MHLTVRDNGDSSMSAILVLDGGTEIDLSQIAFRDMKLTTVGDVPEFQELGLTMTFAVTDFSCLLGGTEDRVEIDAETWAREFVRLADERKAAAPDLAAEIEAAGATVDES